MDRALISKAAGALSVQAVLLRSSSVEADDELLPPKSRELTLVVHHRGAPLGGFEVSEIEDNGQRFKVITYGFLPGIRLLEAAASTAGGDAKLSSADPANPAVRLEMVAAFAAIYRLDADADVEALRPALEEFGKYNVGLHVWPYWREYVQSTCARMGIQNIPVAMYRLPDPPQGEADEERKTRTRKKRTAARAPGS